MILNSIYFLDEYVSERFDDYNNEELVETSTEYDLSLLELEELKELKASLEKKLGMFKNILLEGHNTLKCIEK